MHDCIILIVSYTFASFKYTKVDAGKKTWNSSFIQ